MREVNFFAIACSKANVADLQKNPLPFGRGANLIPYVAVYYFERSDYKLLTCLSSSL